MKNAAKNAAKPDWQIAIEQLATTTTEAIAKGTAESKAEADKRAEEAAARAKEADVRMSRIEKQIGELGNTIGRELENAVIDYLMDARVLCGIPVDNLHPRLRSATPHCEFDAVVINGSKVIVLEAKRHLTVKSVREFVDRQLPLFAVAFPGMARGKEVIGAMVYQRTHAEGKAVRAALNAGLYVLYATSGKELRQITTEQEITERHPRAAKGA